LYQLAKARVLGLGYGCGPAQFVRVAKILAGLEISLDEAKRIVADFRRNNPATVALWGQLEERFRADAEAGADMHTIALPSGRWLRYFQPDLDSRGQVVASVVRGPNAPKLRWHGPKLTENLVQATARDVFASALLRIHDRGAAILWTVHDEVIVEARKEEEEAVKALVLEELRRTPAWMPGLPLEAEGETMEAYRK
ncbi:MAG: hypothetical protein D6701_00140, partial [Gemmatimonadetes bacterium]